MDLRKAPSLESEHAGPGRKVRQVEANEANWANEVIEVIGAGEVK